MLQATLGCEFCYIHFIVVYTEACEVKELGKKTWSSSNRGCPKCILRLVVPELLLPMMKGFSHK